MKQVTMKKIFFDDKTELESDDYESDYDDFLTDDDLDFSDNSF